VRFRNRLSRPAIVGVRIHSSYEDIGWFDIEVIRGVGVNVSTDNSKKRRGMSAAAHVTYSDPDRSG
jgi:hypothetical protein